MFCCACIRWVGELGYLCYIVLLYSVTMLYCVCVLPGVWCLFVSDHWFCFVVAKLVLKFANSGATPVVVCSYFGSPASTLCDETFSSDDDVSASAGSGAIVAVGVVCNHTWSPAEFQMAIQDGDEFHGDDVFVVPAKDDTVVAASKLESVAKRMRY